METTAEEGCGGAKTTANADAQLNPSDNIDGVSTGTVDDQGDERTASNPVQPLRLSSTARTPFTNLSQEEADLALARTLQEQERAYMMLRMNNEGSEYGSWETGSYVLDVDEEEDFDDPHGEDGGEEEEEEEEDEDEDAFNMHVHDDDEEDENPGVEFDPAVFSSDEAYARALQDAEEREVAGRLLALAGINDRVAADGDEEDHGIHSQDAWEDVDPDELSYEELLALGEVVGTESRGLSVDKIASLPSVKYEGSSQNGSNDSCVICRLEFEDNETLTMLSCKHLYHSECINHWLQINKVCPVCSTEVSISGDS